jgi:protein involved in polysaccharide export with SLBB domain
VVKKYRNNNIVMKRYIIFTLLFMICSAGVMAQSSMTDEQVMKYVLKEHEAGTSQSQIAIQLIQRGVSMEQLRRVRKKYNDVAKDKNLGQLSNSTDKSTDDRTRKNNGDKKQTTKKKTDTNYMVKDGKVKTHTYDENDEDYTNMQDELSTFIPDSAEWEKQMWEMEYEMKRQKKVFGRDIFNNKELTFEPSMNIATPQTYRIGPGDEVIIDVYGASQKSETLTVSPDGDVTIEGFGPINVSGLTVEQANAKVRSQLGARYSSSKVRLTVGQTRTIMVNVVGEVKTPGTYTLSAFATVFNALYLAGGIGELGTLRNIKVYRNFRLITVVDVYDYILNGKLTGNIRLQDNDMIVVGPYDCLVDVTGKVKRPMYYEMKKNESVETLLKYAGGFTGDAYTKSVRLVRKTGRERSIYNVGEFDMASFHLADQDSLSVDSILDRFSNKVEIKGAVFHPGMYQVGGDITTVRSLLEHAEGATEEAFTQHAVMHRLKEDRTLEVVSVDIDGILSGKVPDIPLKNGDVLFIPTKQEIEVEQTITIHGEVQNPGTYKYAANETLEDFVLQAGGLKETASTVKVDVARRVSDPKALRTDTLIAHTYTFALKDGFVIDGESGFTLMPFDEVYVRKSPGYNKQQNVTVDGEVMFSGTYTLSKRTERLSDVVKAAGGPNDRAYIKGARLERRINESERLRMEAVLKMAQEQLEDVKAEEIAKNSNVAAASNLGTNSQRSKKFDIGETYYVGIELDKALAHPGGDEDIIMREGDRIIVPQYNGTVKINGEVMYPNTVGYRDGKKVSYYIDQAGGFSSKAKKSQTYIIYMNGTVAKVGHNAKPSPGCEIVVPAKATNKMSMAETLTIGTSVASIATMIATLANILK